MPECTGSSSHTDSSDITNLASTSDQTVKYAAAEKYTDVPATCQPVPTVASFHDPLTQASASDIPCKPDQGEVQRFSDHTSETAALDVVHAPTTLPVSTAAAYTDADTVQSSLSRSPQLQIQQPIAIVEAVEVTSDGPSHIAITVQEQSADPHSISGTLPLQRSSSNISSASQTGLRECRICLSSDSPEDLVQPCSCTGSVKYAHMECLKAWVHERCNLQCELCGKQYRDEVKPQLEPLIAGRRPRRGRSRTVRVVNADGEAVMSVEAADGEDEEEEERPRISWTRFWIHLGILVVLLVAVLYLALFVNVGASDNFWLMFLWRAITVILPLFLIIRCVAALYAWRQQYVASQQRR